MWDPIGDVLSGVGNFFSDVLRNAVAALIQGVTEAIKAIGTYWMYLPAPVLQGEGGSPSPAERVQMATEWAVPIVGIAATCFALVTIARRRDTDSVMDSVMGLFRVVLVSAAVIPAAYLATRFSDGAAPWLLNTISGGTFEDGLGQLNGLDAAAASGMGIGVLVLLLVVLPFALVGGILNMILVMFSYGALPIVVGIMPLAAAWSMTARGRASFWRTVGWLGALVLFKPVAAIIYGVGIASARMVSGDVGDQGMVVIQALYGCVVLCAAGIALPVLVRLLAPAAAAGSQGASGGGLLVGAAMVAAGAVTGGATAVAGVSSRSAATSTVAAATEPSGSSTAAATTAKSSTSSGTGKATESTATPSAGDGSGSNDGGSSPTGSGTSAETAKTDGTSQGSSASTGGTSPSGGTGGGERSRRLRSEGVAHLRTQANMADGAAEQGDNK